MTATDGFFAACRSRVQRLLQDCLPPAGEPVADAMRHASLGDAKRFRPQLVYATAHCLKTPLEQVDALAACVELIHCYSLIHDDLPAMDDAAMRRGAVSCHLKFGEDMAILAGDGLQPIAFGQLCALPETSEPDRLQRLLNELTAACGWSGMVRGQMLDMQLSGRRVKLHQVEQIHRLKTAALIEASVVMAAIQCGPCDAQNLDHLRRYAGSLGLAFQARDDLIDAISISASVGKHTGADLASDKPSMVAVLGVAGTGDRVGQLLGQAQRELELFGDRAACLHALAEQLKALPA